MIEIQTLITEISEADTQKQKNDIFHQWLVTSIVPYCREDVGKAFLRLPPDTQIEFRRLVLGRINKIKDDVSLHPIIAEMMIDTQKGSLINPHNDGQVLSTISKKVSGCA